MPKMVLLSSMLQVNSVDLSSYLNKCELALSVDEKDVTTFASLGWKEVLGGIKSGTISPTFQQDIAAGNIDSQMFALFGTVTTFEIRLTSAARSTSNPAYTGSFLLSKWNPIAGSVGDDAQTSVAWPTSGVVLRQTS